MANIYFGSCFHPHWLQSKCVSISFCVWSPIVERNHNKIKQWMEFDAVNFLYHFLHQMSLFAISVLQLLLYSHRDHIIVSFYIEGVHCGTIIQMMKSLGEEHVISPYYSWWSALHWDSSRHYPPVPSPCNLNSFVPASGVSMIAVMNHWHWHNDSQMNEDLNAHFHFHCLNPERQKKQSVKRNVISWLSLSVSSSSDTARSDA